MPKDYYSADKEQVRSFIAVELPQAVKEGLATLQKELKLAGHTAVKWVAPEGIHLTLKFLGNVSTTKISGIVGALERVAAEFSAFRLETLINEVTTIQNNGKHKIVGTTQNNFITSAIIIAGGCQRRKLRIPGEDKFTGRGVSYCATCDGPLFRDKRVSIVGGGNAALTEALSLTKFASSVKVIHRRHQLRATQILQKKAFKEPKIEFIWNTIVTEIEGNSMVSQLKLKEVTTDKISTLKVAGVFVAIGLIPNTNYLKGIVPLDKMGYIITNELMETRIPGIFAAGDIRYNSYRQLITAAGDGATAALSAERFLKELG